jgi:hypothetical protein
MVSSARPRLQRSRVWLRRLVINRAVVCTVHLLLLLLLLVAAAAASEAVGQWPQLN